MNSFFGMRPLCDALMLIKGILIGIHEILMVLDIFPLQEINLCEDVEEQIEVLKKHLARKKVFTDPQDEAMRKRLLSFVEEFEAGRIPEYVELKTFFWDRLGIQDAKTFRSEMKFLGDLIRNH